MKMVKSLILGSAAALVAVGGAQAADLPVKAKAVEYVKVCSLYGAGFYYIPGTDICMKVGGYIRWQETWNPGNNISGGPFLGTGGRQTRVDSQDYAQRTRALATFDTRQQTAYGTLRTYLLLGFNQDSTSGPTTAPTVYMTRGFVQIAGFTFGKATSFFDFTSTAAVAYNAGMLYAADTGDAGQMVAGYTAQFGNGLSATIAIEQARRKGTVNLNASTSEFNISSLTTGCNDLGGLQGTTTSTTTCNVGLQDIVGNLRIDQAWGSAQFSAATGDRSNGYYSSSLNLNPGEPQGHGATRWGWTVAGGLRLNAPMIGPGDYFQIQGIYSVGMTGYLAQTPSGAAQNFWKGNSVGYGFWSDGVYTNPNGVLGGSIQLTTGWSVMGSYEHFWTPSLRTSIYGSYVALDHNAAATAAICSTQGAGVGASNSAFQGANCNPDWSAWNIGSRSQWNITKDLYVGLDVIYMKLNSANSGNAGNTINLASQSGGKPVSVYTVGDQDTWAATWRIHRDIVP